MNKKITAIVLSAMMILSMFTYINVSAQVTLPENIGTDYTAGAITGNYFSGFSNVYAVTYSNNGSELTLTTTGAMGDGLVGASQERGAYGAGVGTTSKDFWEKGNTIVFGAKAKNNGGVPRVKFAVWQATNPAIMPLETPGITDGVAVTNTEWENLSYTMTIPETGSNDKNNIILGFGFAETPAGETEGERSVKVDVASAYLGIESVYDINVTASNTSVMAGNEETIELTAEVLNQVAPMKTLEK